MKIFYTHNINEDIMHTYNISIVHIICMHGGGGREIWEANYVDFENTRSRNGI